MQKFDSLGDSLRSIDWKSQSLKSFARNFYKVTNIIFIDVKEHKFVSERSDEEIKSFRKSN
jgi:hypothetical protein